MITDCHTHLYTTSHCESFGVAGEQTELVNRALEAGIDKIAVSSLGRKDYLPYPSEEEVSQANSDVIKLMRMFPDKVYGFCYLNPGNKNCLEEIKRCADAGMKGVKLWIAAKASSPRIIPIIEEAIKMNLIILQHSSLRTKGNRKGESTPFDVAYLGEKYPEAKIIMAHAGANQHVGIEAVQKFSNIYVDTSGGYPERGMVENVVAILGAKRILFGSDVPGRSFTVQLAKVQAANISEAEKKSILGENFLGLLSNGTN